MIAPRPSLTCCRHHTPHATRPPPKKQHTTCQVATLRSAVKLEQEQQFLIAKKLQELTGSKNIKLKPIIDQSLIAGFVVEYGSSQIDLSVK
jgi:F-type H+-transporting ATPase subunit delta